MEEFTKIVPSAFGPFIGHPQALFVCVKSVFSRVFWAFFITLQNYVNTKLDKTEMLMTLNKFKTTLLIGTEYYQEKSS